MSNCESCGKRPPEPVPYVVHESDMARQERTIKRLWILLLVLVVLFVGSNAAWVWYESQFIDTVETSYDIEQDTDGGGNNYVVGGDFNGEAKGQGEDNANPNP